MQMYLAGVSVRLAGRTTRGKTFNLSHQVMEIYHSFKW